MTTDERICATVGSLVIENARLLSQVDDLKEQLNRLLAPGPATSSPPPAI